MRRLAIIPARGGSKRIIGKNIKSFYGKPMISYIVNTAKSSNLFDKIHVSTDSLAIKNVVKNNNLNVDFMRPKYLADDQTPIMPVLKFVVEKYKKSGEEFDQIWLLMACSPLINSSDLIKAEKVYNSYEPTNKLISVARYPAPIEWAYKKSKKGILKAVLPGAFKTPSEKIDVSYYDTGNFCIFSTKEVLKSEGAGNGEKYIPYEIPFIRGIDIDDETDWKIAEKLYLSFNNPSLIK